jgi:hypothetical protein
MSSISLSTSVTDLKGNRIETDGSFWFPESGEKNRRCKKYGITPNTYNKLFNEQEGCCAICGVHQSELPYTMCIDHDHITGEVRGLLCFRCNTGLGNFEDKAELLERATNYLKLSKN